ncbi:hypothetical protein OSTOST_10385 [Ostertagia ostertagi]
MSKKLRDADENKASRGQIHVNFQGHTTTRDQSDNAAGRIHFLFRRRVKRPRFSLRYSNQSPGKCSTSFFIEKDTHSLRVPLYSVTGSLNSGLCTIHVLVARPTLLVLSMFSWERRKTERSPVCTTWLRFYTLEKNATENFDYKGFVIKRGNVMASVKFTWKGDLKRSGSILLGTSPEYDMALYTLCFLSRRGRDQCEVEIDGCPLAITSFDIVQNNKVFIGSIFPTAGPLTEQCRRLSGRV